MLLRTARPDDASAIAPLIYSSSVDDHDYAFTVKEHKAEDFIRYACETNAGIWGYSLATVVDINSVLAATITSYPWNRLTVILLSGFVAMLRFYGLKDGLGVVYRSVKVGLRFKAIPRYGIYVANLGTNLEYRGQGYATKLYEAIHEHWRQKRFKYAVCDVAHDNQSSRRILDRVGYIAVPAIDPHGPQKNYRMMRAL
ncbi:MAG: N-acetyltransferase [Proteobacteria bacterium]|nr:MAG: N-acetyltransferase [Pseudomonadota bacterium]